MRERARVPASRRARRSGSHARADAGRRGAWTPGVGVPRFSDAVLGLRGLGEAVARRILRRDRGERATRAQSAPARHDRGPLHGGVGDARRGLSRGLRMFARGPVARRERVAVRLRRVLSHQPGRPKRRLALRRAPRPARPDRSEDRLQVRALAPAVHRDGCRDALSRRVARERPRHAGRDHARAMASRAARPAGRRRVARLRRLPLRGVRDVLRRGNREDPVPRRFVAPRSGRARGGARRGAVARRGSDRGASLGRRGRRHPGPCARSNADANAHRARRRAHVCGRDELPRGQPVRGHAGASVRRSAGHVARRHRAGSSLPSRWPWRASLARADLAATWNRANLVLPAKAGDSDVRMRIVPPPGTLRVRATLLHDGAEHGTRELAMP